jgi:hypothetical protein
MPTRIERPESNANPESRVKASFKIRNAMISSALVFALAFALAGPKTTNAQTAAPKPQTSPSAPNFSGDWGFTDKHPAGGSFSVADPAGRKAGLPDDPTPYKPETLAKLRAERPENGPNATFENTTDPRLRYCDPIGVPRIYLVPTEFRIIQTPGIVYILYQYGPTWRPIPMNKEHSKDPDPSWWGESVGRYEGDTLVIDTIGFNDKTWLDHAGRSHSEDLHLIERLRRLDHETLQLDVTFEDPKMYTKPWTGQKTFGLEHTPMGDSYSCSMSEYEHFRQSVIDPVVEGKPAK